MAGEILQNHHGLVEASDCLHHPKGYIMVNVDTVTGWREKMRKMQQLGVKERGTGSRTLRTRVGMNAGSVVTGSENEK